MQICKKRDVRRARAYAEMARSLLFAELFDCLGSLGEDELNTVKRVFSIFGKTHAGKSAKSSEGEERLIRVE